MIMPRIDCPECEGKGYVIEKAVSADGIFHRIRCKKCKGTGMLPSVFQGGLE